MNQIADALHPGLALDDSKPKIKVFNSRTRVNPEMNIFLMTLTFSIFTMWDFGLSPVDGSTRRQSFLKTLKKGFVPEYRTKP